jgi:methylthioribose-1-phosphate isomerase
VTVAQEATPARDRIALPPSLPHPVEWLPDGAGIRILDQRRLPDDEVWLTLTAADEVVAAIRTLAVRGAPLIGIAAAMGLAGAATRAANLGTLDDAWMERVIGPLLASRPTAVNLGWALDRLRRVWREACSRGEPPGGIASRLREEADRIHAEDALMCRLIGESGAALVPQGATILTHCNTGVLATGGIGTALGVVYTAHAMGRAVRVIATETRPLRQGARLTAWELSRAGVPVNVIADSAAASLMAKGEVDLVVTGADRIATNGDTANKIGTYMLAVLADAHRIPFYVAAPTSTFDPALPSGAGIPIERRDPAELDAAPGVEARNPAFDVTPARLIQAIVTNRGVLRPPYPTPIAGILHP